MFYEYERHEGIQRQETHLSVVVVAGQWVALSIDRTCTNLT